MKRKRKLWIACILLVSLLVCCMPSASALGYSSEISSIMSTFSLQNIYADSAPQQQVNGSYRTVELLEVIAHEKGCSSSSVSSIMSTFSLQNIYADSAVQQAVNGAYRTVELLELIALKWD
ncbi:MAG: hypothetical protein E7335_11730 [Clostridiales bacterium]|nr:hypothetical protein [Clostridiales bacterium]